MAQPYIQWITQQGGPGSVTYANISGGTHSFTVTTGATDATPHKLSNDTITISKISPAGLKDPAGNDIGDKYYATFNSVSRSDTPYTPSTPADEDGPGSPAVPAYSTYSYADNGHMSLNGGVFELLPFTAGVSPATSVTYFDFAGTGRSPYPASYVTNDGSPQVAGMLVCGAYTNIESSHSYTIGTQEVRSVRDAYWSYGSNTPAGPGGIPPATTATQGAYGTGGTASQEGTPASGTDPGISPSPASISGQFDSYRGDTTAPAISLYGLTGQLWPSSGLTITSTNKISENYTVGGTYHNGTAVADVHTGAIEFEILSDTEAIIKSGNVTKTTTGTASWGAGQARTVTFACASPHCLTDANNRVYVTGASNNAINGLWNVATVTSDTAFTARIFGATCATITSSVNIVTYDGIDKAGGVLKGSGVPDLTVIAGGMAGNNQVILKGEVNPQAGISYTFWGNTTTAQLVGTVEFTGERKQRSMFTDAKLTLNSVTGSVSTGGEYNAATNIDGGMKEIDHWCPRNMHAKIKALERNNPAELFKANTSGQHALDQMLASPMVDGNDNITTFLPLHETFHESIHFTMRAQKKPAHRRTSTFIEDQDWIKRDFYINVFNNSLSDRNEIILDYVDITNKTIIANTDLAFTDLDGNLQTNTEHLANGYSNGVFTNL